MNSSTVILIYATVGHAWSGLKSFNSLENMVSWITRMEHIYGPAFTWWHRQ